MGWVVPMVRVTGDWLVVVLGGGATRYALETVGVRRPPKRKPLSLDCGRRTPQLKRKPFGRCVRQNRSPGQLVRQHLLLAATYCLSSACAGTRPQALDGAHRRALIDTVSTIFDSLTAIHRDHPDTGALRRLHPPADTIQFVEGALIETFTGDSLFRRVRALHVPVRAMSQRFSDRTGYLLDANHAVLTAVEKVDWVDTAGTHQYSGLLTITVSRRGPRWVIRTYRGS